MGIKSLKICQLCSVDFTLKNFLLPLIDGMESRGWEVVSVCSDGPYISDLRARGYQIRTLTLARSINPFKAFRSLVCLVELFKQERFDVIHVHTPVAALLGRLAAKITGAPLVVYTAHGFYFHEGMPNWKYRVFVALERLGGRYTDLLFTQSAEDALVAVTEKIISQERVLNIGNGVDVSRFSPGKASFNKPIRELLGIPESAYVLGFVGRQVREKGIGDFLRAARKLARSYPQLWLLIVGERLVSDHGVGVEEEYLEAKEVFQERIILTGLRDDIPEILSAMDLFCLPSWREGMPRSIIEAMMMAKPVLATDIRGSREEVVQGKTGMLVAVGSPDELSDAIESFITNPNKGKDFGIAGRARALDLYDERKVVEKQLDRVEEEFRRNEKTI